MSDLLQEALVGKDINVPNNDTISRQAAIDALADYIHNVDKVYSTGHLSMSDCEDAARSVIEGLPSAQPEIIRCKDCKWWDKYGENHGYCMRVRRWGEYFCADAERREE